MIKLTQITATVRLLGILSCASISHTLPMCVFLHRPTTYNYQPVRSCHCTQWLLFFLLIIRYTPIQIRAFFWAQRYWSHIVSNSVRVCLLVSAIVVRGHGESHSENCDMNVNIYSTALLHKCESLRPSVSLITWRTVKTFEWKERKKLFEGIV